MCGDRNFAAGLQPARHAGLQIVAGALAGGNRTMVRRAKAYIII